MQIKPLQDRVLVRPLEAEVIATGPGARGEDGKVHPLDVSAGNRVLIGKWSGTEVTLDGEELLIMKESDIMAVIETKKGKKKGKRAA